MSAHEKYKKPSLSGKTFCQISKLYFNRFAELAACYELCITIKNSEGVFFNENVKGCAVSLYVFKIKVIKRRGERRLDGKGAHTRRIHSEKSVRDNLYK